MLELVVGPVAHGGFCVARADGRVVFVRHALPGERVRARVTDASHDRYWRADAVDILDAAPQRVAVPCPHAGPGRCGGCDWQHADLAAQRQGKAEVVADALRRFGGVELAVDVEAVPVEVAAVEAGAGGRSAAPDDGLGWRTRMRFAVTADGEIGLRASRSHQVVATPDCRIAHPLVAAALAGRRFVGAESVEVAASPSTGQVSVTVRGDAPASSPAVRDSLPVSAGPTAGNAAGDQAGRTVSGTPASHLGAGDGPVEGGPVVEKVAGRRFTVGPDAFWQIHPRAPEVLVEAVRTALRARPGETALDLYAGAGLFAAFLAADVGPHGRVVAMESDPAAVSAAADNLADLPQVSLRGVRVTPATVRGVLGGGPVPAGVDIAVLDPPRSGVGAEVMTALLAYHPRAVAYVACDPVALARDLAVASKAGYDLVSLRVFDLFPMTHHVECVALLAPSAAESEVTAF
ncbi:class I SAM-dependent RNA methyltransferase [Frankia sp. AgB32]|nr:TRAM domain-containing protein [Frankia sp. AgB32]MCK9897274.1 class I SAM-dependent RNA methyltransferase [Frankia sp. AgB32]